MYIILQGNTLYIIISSLAKQYHVFKKKSKMSYLYQMFEKKTHDLV